jgi:hypothetical protein
MPAVCDISLSLKTREALRRGGLGGEGRVRPRTRILIQELLANVTKADLAEPALAYAYYTVRAMSGGKISLDGDRAINGPLLPAIFPEAKELAVLLCTIDPGLEEQVTDYNKRGGVMRAAIPDRIGGSTVGMTSSGVLAHRKSTSMVMGIGPHMTRWTHSEVCARCSLRKACHYKVGA